MFDIGFSELLLVFVIGLIVLGPERLPVAVKTVVGWIRAIRSLAANVQQELTQELKLQELQDSLKKVEEAGKGTLSPELKESIEELRKTADSVKRSYHESVQIERDEDEASHTASVASQTATKQDNEKTETKPANSSRLITPETEVQQHVASVESTSATASSVTHHDTPPEQKEDKA